VSSQLADFLEPKLFVRLPGVLILGGPASIMNPKILSKGGKRMSEAIGCGKSQKSESVLGLLRYYEAILERKGLVARIGEIRSLKLGLILDLLKMVNIAEELKDKLISSMVSAWEMNGNDNALEESEEEIKSMLDSIADVRENALIAQHNCDPINLTRMDVSVMFALPLMTHDLNYNDIPQIRDLLNQVMEDFAERNEGGFALCP
jgi:hypothetical protein